MACCATSDCGDPLCPVCSVPRRFPRPEHQPRTLKESDGLKPGSKALNGTKKSTKAKK